MSAINQDIIIDQGSPLDLTITWTVRPKPWGCSAVPCSGTPVDMTGMELSGNIFTGFGPEDYQLAVLSCDVINASAGQFSVYLPAISSANFYIDPDKSDFQSPIYPLGFYQIQIVEGDRILEGEVTLKKLGPTNTKPFCNDGF
jgi:hypothetical protein